MNCHNSTLNKSIPIGRKYPQATMSEIPNFIEFTTVPQHYFTHHHSFDPELDVEPDDDSVNITSQDLTDLKVMVQQMKSNPSLIVSKNTVSELKSSLKSIQTQKTATSSTMSAETTKEDISPPPRAKITVNTEEPSKNGALLSFPRLPPS